MPRKKRKFPKDLRQKMIGVKVNPAEYELIHAKAEQFGLLAPEFLRSVAMNYPIRSTVE